MNFEPDTTVSFALDDAYQRAPLLRRNVQSLLSCAHSEEGKFLPVVTRLSCEDGEVSELSGLMDELQQRQPSALVVLPDEADEYLDALLEKHFSPVATYYEGLMKCMAAYSVSDEVSGLTIEMNALWGLGDEEFFLAVVCKDKLRVRRITNQPPLGDDELQGISYSVGNYRPYRVFSEEQIDEAARLEREPRTSPYWLVREVVRLDRLKEIFPEA